MTYIKCKQNSFYGKNAIPKTIQIKGGIKRGKRSDGKRSGFPLPVVLSNPGKCVHNKDGKHA